MLAKVWDGIKMAAFLAVMTFMWLSIEYGDNCTRYRAPWCDLLDSIARHIPVPAR